MTRRLAELADLGKAAALAQRGGGSRAMAQAGTRRLGPIEPTVSPSMVTKADETRWTTPRLAAVEWRLKLSLLSYRRSLDRSPKEL